MTLLGDLSRACGFYRSESGRANHERVDGGFAERLATGIYNASKLQTKNLVARKNDDRPIRNF